MEGALAADLSCFLRLLLFALVLSTVECSGPESIPSPFRDTRLPLERRVSDLMSRMHPDEKIALVRGVQTLSSRENSRLGIPALSTVDGAMGISAKDTSGKPVVATAFPANIAMAATWNPGLMEQVGIVIAQQARALGRGQILGPLTDVAKSTLSGRVFETYGEDPWLVSRMAIGYIGGVQGEGDLATAVFDGGPTDTRIAREFDVRPLEAAVVEGGTWSVKPRDGNPIDGFLYSQLGFRGFSVVPENSTALDNQVSGILRGMFASGLFDSDISSKASATVLETPAHRTIARAVAAQSLVLLKNADGLLPLDRERIHSIAVIGPNATVNRMAGGSHTVAARYGPAPLDALRAVFGATVVSAASPAETAKADIAIVFVGTGAGTEEEGRDRTSLDLPAGQDELIEAVARANPRTIVVVNSGSAVAMDRWIGRVPAVVEAWFPGEEGGNAIVDVLSGAVNPSGRLPLTFPAAMKDLPAANAGLEPGYRHFDRAAIQPLFAFGFGLSYTKFEYTNLTVNPPRVAPGQFAELGVTIRNAGTRAGRETVQVYLSAQSSASSIDRAVQDLRAFQQVYLNAGEAKRLHFTLSTGATAYFDEKKQDWVQDQAVFEVRVGSSSRDIRATAALAVAE